MVENIKSDFINYVFETFPSYITYFMKTEEKKSVCYLLAFSHVRVNIREKMFIVNDENFIQKCLDKPHIQDRTPARGFFLYNVQDWIRSCKIKSVIQDFSKCPNVGIP